MKGFLSLLFFFLFSTISIFAIENWQDHWHKGFDFYQKNDFKDAELEFDIAVNLMSEEDQKMYPYVLVYRAESNYFLGNYPKVMQDTEKALKSEKLTGEERLTCGARRSSIYYMNDDLNSAIKEYQKYVVESPLIPKMDFSDNKIIIRNVLDSEDYKQGIRYLMMSRYCKSLEDIHDYGNTWIIDRTKNSND